MKIKIINFFNIGYCEILPRFTIEWQKLHTKINISITIGWLFFKISAHFKKRRIKIKQGN